MAAAATGHVFLHAGVCADGVDCAAARRLGGRAAAAAAARPGQEQYVHVLTPGVRRDARVGSGTTIEKEKKKGS